MAESRRVPGRALALARRGELEELDDGSSRRAQETHCGPSHPSLCKARRGRRSAPARAGPRRRGGSRNAHGTRPPPPRSPTPVRPVWLIDLILISPGSPRGGGTPRAGPPVLRSALHDDLALRGGGDHLVLPEEGAEGGARRVESQGEEGLRAFNRCRGRPWCCLPSPAHRPRARARPRQPGRRPCRGSPWPTWTRQDVRPC